MKKTIGDLEAEVQRRKAALDRLEARVTGQRRKIDTRRKILAGAWLLHRAAVDDDLRALLRLELPMFLSQRDCGLFPEIL